MRIWRKLRRTCALSMRHRYEKEQRAFWLSVSSSKRLHNKIATLRHLQAADKILDSVMAKNMLRNMGKMRLFIGRGN